MRDNLYLQEKLDDFWKKYFCDVPQINKIEIKFGRKAKKRLGSIRKRYNGSCSFDTLILINGHFKDKKVPNFIIDATIAHELCHYAHGFSSPLPKLSPFPHKGGLVNKEMLKRGLGDLQFKEEQWLNKNWHRFIS